MQKLLASKWKVDQLTANLKAAYLHIDKKLEEIKAGLEGEAITCMEVLNVRENRLKQVREVLKESKSLVSSIIDEDPNQTVALVDAEGAKALEADTKISACEEILARFRATINKASGTGTTIEASDAPTTRRPIGPRFERQSLPNFKSGELREYPTFKKDWEEMVKGNFEPAQE